MNLFVCGGPQHFVPLFYYCFLVQTQPGHRPPASGISVNEVAIINSNAEGIWGIREEAATASSNASKFISSLFWNSAQLSVVVVANDRIITTCSSMYNVWIRPNFVSRIRRPFTLLISVDPLREGGIARLRKLTKRRCGLDAKNGKKRYS